MKHLGCPANQAQIYPNSWDQHKLDPGKDLVRMFCMPEGGGPGNPLNEPRWHEFVEYNRVDVEVLRAIEQKLRVFPVPESEWRLWALDQHINDRGLPIDMPFVRAAATLGESHKARVMGESRETTGLDNPNSREQLLKWIKDAGVDAPDLRASTVEALLEKKDLPVPVRDALEQRQQLSMSSLAKYGTLLEAVGDDRQLRGVLQFYGASTGRWSSRLFNLQNCPRGNLKEHDLVPARDYVLRNDTQMIQMLWGDVSGVLSSLVRSAIHAPKNQQLVVADYASIESVMLAWASGCQTVLNVFREGRDSYKDFATKLFNVKYEEVTKEQRSISKPACLCAGYGMGFKGLQNYAAGMGIHLSDADARRHVNTYRAAYPEIPQFWADAEQAAATAIQKRTTVTAGHFTYRYQAPYLFIDLPSGRALAYYKAALDDIGVLSYEGRESGKQARITTRGSVLVENLVQAISRDVLAHGLTQASAAPGLEIVGHVHDEIIALASDSDTSALDRLLACMTSPPWAPDAPIRAAGWSGPFYRKDPGIRVYLSHFGL
ncbi:DNA polymerase bacteriophage-type [Gammaproteobacteria bacterium]